MGLSFYSLFRTSRPARKRPWRSKVLFSRWRSWRWSTARRSPRTCKPHPFRAWKMMLPCRLCRPSPPLKHTRRRVLIWVENETRALWGVSVLPVEIRRGYHFQGSWWQWCAFRRGNRIAFWKKTHVLCSFAYLLRHDFDPSFWTHPLVYRGALTPPLGSLPSRRLGWGVGGHVESWQLRAGVDIAQPVTAALPQPEVRGHHVLLIPTLHHDIPPLSKGCPGHWGTVHVARMARNWRELEISRSFLAKGRYRWDLCRRRFG